MEINKKTITVDVSVMRLIELLSGHSEDEILGNFFYLSAEQVDNVIKKRLAKPKSNETFYTRIKIVYPNIDLALSCKTKYNQWGYLETAIYPWKSTPLIFSRDDVENRVVENILLKEDL